MARPSSTDPLWWPIGAPSTPKGPNGQTIYTQGAGSTSSTTPKLPFEDAIRQYQQQNGTANKQTFEGLFGYLQGLGYRVARPSHAGNTLLSDDKVVDVSANRMYDVIFASDDPTQAKWQLNYVGTWDGRTLPGAPGYGFVPGSSNDPLGSETNARQPGEPPERGGSRQDTGPGGATHPAHGGDPGSAGGKTTTSSSPSSADDATSAYGAQRRARARAAAGGRRGTILGGFTGGAPLTRQATLLGRTG